MGARLGAVCAEVESVDDVSAQVTLAHSVMAAAGLFRLLEAVTSGLRIEGRPQQQLSAGYRSPTPR
jgi:hypothetical protein